MMRKPHQKTRTGCTQCRHRRIKCTEEKPVCFQCHRHSLECKYLSPNTLSARASLAVARTHQAMELARPTQSMNSPSKALDINLLDLELLHFYSNSTFETFASGHSDTWRTHVPQLAFSSKYLMHGLLATTALHFAKLRPDRSQQLLEAAAGHESLALPHYRTATDNLDPANYETIFIFAAFVVAYASAHPQHDPSEFPPRWLLLLRSSLKLLSNVWPWFAGTPLAPVHHGPDGPADYLHNPDDPQLFSLYQFLETVELYGNDTSEDIEVYRDTLDTLRWSSSLMAYRNARLCNQAAAYIWPRYAPDRFFELLRERRPKALILMAHYCVQLYSAEFSWYFKGAAARILHGIRQSLPEEMQAWLSWPMHEIMFGERKATCRGGDGPRGHGESQCTDFMLFYSSVWDSSGSRASILPA